jgi:hypothetical protein
MNRFLYSTWLTVLLHAAQYSYAQPGIQWQKCLGGIGEEEAGAMGLTSDGGYIMAGSTSYQSGDVSGHHGSTDAWVVKLDVSGVMEWQKCLGGSGWEGATSIQQTTDGGYLMVGSTNSTNGNVSGFHGGFSDAWVVKLDAAGEIEWQRCLGGSFTDEGSSVLERSDGGYVVACTTASNDGDLSESNPDGGGRAWVVGLDESGEIEWQSCIGGDENANSIRCIRGTLDGAYIVAGGSGPILNNMGCNHGVNGDAWVAKLDAIGAVQWQRCLGGSASDPDAATCIHPLMDGGFIMAGNVHSNDGDVSGFHGGSAPDAWAVRLNADGGILWQRCLGGSATDAAWAVEPTMDGGFVFAGYTISTDGDVSGLHGGYDDAWIVKLDGAGVLEWQRCLGGVYGEVAYAIQQTTDGGFAMAGYTLSNDGDVSGNHSVPHKDAWVVKLGPDDVGIDDDEIPQFTFLPNPTTGILIITHTADLHPKYAAVFDATGHEVWMKAIEGASGSITLDLSGYESGLFLVRVLFADDTCAMERVLKL